MWLVGGDIISPWKPWKVAPLGTDCVCAPLLISVFIHAHARSVPVQRWPLQPDASEEISDEVCVCVCGFHKYDKRPRRWIDVGVRVRGFIWNSYRITTPAVMDGDCVTNHILLGAELDIHTLKWQWIRDAFNQGHGEVCVCSCTLWVLTGVFWWRCFESPTRVSRARRVDDTLPSTVNVHPIQCRLRRLSFCSPQTSASSLNHISAMLRFILMWWDFPVPSDAAACPMSIRSSYSYQCIFVSCTRVHCLPYYDNPSRMSHHVSASEARELSAAVLPRPRSISRRYAINFVPLSKQTAVLNSASRGCCWPAT